jgi:hypothetical protein
VTTPHSCSSASAALAAKVVEHWAEEDEDLSDVPEREMVEAVGETPQLSDRGRTACGQGSKCGLVGRTILSLLADERRDARARAHDPQPPDADDDVAY